MKKALALLLALVLVAGLVGCADKTTAKNTKEAFESSKTAFNNTTKAYKLVNEYSKDVYEAWRLGINDEYSYDNDYELEDFCNELLIDQGSVKKAIASLLGIQNYTYGDWELLQSLYGSFFSACVSVVSEAYVVNGTAAEIEELLTEAKAEMKTLGDKYSDYTYYPALKSYFTNTLAFFDFCKNPEGSFNQVVETFNNYRNDARTYFFELNYVFEDSIGGMNAEETEGTEGSTEAEEPESTKRPGGFDTTMPTAAPQ